MGKVAIEKIDSSVEERLKSLYELQQIDSKIDKICTVRGEFTFEFRYFKDVVAGLQTRVNKLNEELESLENQISEKKNVMKDSQAAIKKYEAQQGKVRNNREYDSITKEIEFQNLEIQLAEKRIKEYKASIVTKKEVIENAENELKEKEKDLKIKRKELDDIIAETEKDEASLLKKSKNSESNIDSRLLNAYKRLRENVINGLAVVSVERDACGGCFNQIPPQRQLDIRTHKKIIVCEHCGRILVDAEHLN